MPPEKKARRYGLSKRIELEEHLIDYCKELREKQLPLTLTVLYVEALRVNEDPEKKISVYWLWKILKKNGFSNRAVSSVGRKTYSEEVVQEFLYKYVPCFISQPRNLVINMDETCVQFEIIPKRTYDYSGSTNTRLVTSGLEKNPSLWPLQSLQMEEC